MNKIIGRKQEQEELINLYNSNKAEFVAIYGRRRVGKTFLVKELFGSKMTFYHSGLSPYEKSRRINKQAQIEAFYSSLIQYGMDENQCPKSWLEAFGMLGRLLESLDDGVTRQVVFIDELPWLDTPRSQFLVAFEHFWNTWGAWHDRVMLIVCGSASSWILDNLINNQGGLYDRLTWQIKLSPFTLAETREFFQSKDMPLSNYDLLEVYMVLGGIPYYLNYIQRGKSVAQNIDLLFFAPNARFRSEFQRLFGSLFTSPEFYMSVVRLLSSRRSGYTRKEISSLLGISMGGSLTTVIEALSASDFISSYIPFGHNKKDVHYRLCDSFCQFALQFVDQDAPSDSMFWQHNQSKPQINSWRGIMFEQVCLNHVRQLKKALGVEGVSSTESAWVLSGNDKQSGAQIDMLII